MEKTLSSEEKLQNISGIEIEGAVRENMQTIVQWAKICSIVGFISIGLNIVGLFNKLSIFSSSTGISLLAINLASIILSFFVNFYLFNFSKNLKNSLANENNEAFRKASVNIKSYFMMIMVMIVVTIILAIVAGGTFAKLFR